MNTTRTPSPSIQSPPLRRTLRDSLLEAEQLRHPIRVITAGGRRLSGVLTEVGIDFAEIQPEERPVDVSLFYIESVAW